MTRAGGIGDSSVTFQTEDGTATAGSDYVATSSTVSFTGGLTTSTVTVSLIDDELVEGDETFAAVLSPVVNALIGDGTGTGTILNDDQAGGTFTIAIGTEGSENPGNATFNVTRSGVTSGTVTVDFATTGGTATSGTDFTAASGTLTFASGVTSQTITVPVLADTVFEGAEQFTLTLSNPTGNATISGSASITGRIVNDFSIQQDILPLNQIDGGIGYEFAGRNANDDAGRSVAFTNDVNGDGVADLIIGASRDDSGGDYNGAAYVIFGGTTNLAALDSADGTTDGSINLSNVGTANGFRIQGNSEGETGAAVAGLGDVGGTCSFGDVLIGDVRRRSFPGAATGAVLEPTSFNGSHWGVLIGAPELRFNGGEAFLVILAHANLAALVRVGLGVS